MLSLGPAIKQLRHKLHIIRNAEHKDLKSLGCALAQDTEYSNWRESDLLEFYSKDNHGFLVIGSEPKGFLVYSQVLDEAEIIIIWVVSGSRNQGLGSKLLNEFLKICRSANINKAFLEVAENNYSAIKLYEANGFREIGRRRAYYTRSNGETIDAITMQYGSF